MRKGFKIGSDKIDILKKKKTPFWAVDESNQNIKIVEVFNNQVKTSNGEYLMFSEIYIKA